MLGATRLRRTGGCQGAPTVRLTDDDVLAFLFDLRVDRRKCHGLNCGPNLLREATERGLVEPDDVEPFVAQMIELRDGGLAGWTPARHDSRGDDLLHAAEFHLTVRGWSRLQATGGFPRLNPRRARSRTGRNRQPD